jgi:hypothetical protein
VLVAPEEENHPEAGADQAASLSSDHQGKTRKILLNENLSAPNPIIHPDHGTKNPSTNRSIKEEAIQKEGMEGKVSLESFRTISPQEDLHVLTNLSRPRVPERPLHQIHSVRKAVLQNLIAAPLVANEKLLKKNRIHASRTVIKGKAETQRDPIRNRFPAGDSPKEVHPISAASQARDAQNPAVIHLESRTRRLTRAKVPNLIFKERNLPAMRARGVSD